MAKYAEFFYSTRKYGIPTLLDFDARPFTADSTTYGVIDLNWVRPSGHYVQFRLLRSSYGYAMNEFDGKLLLDLTMTDPTSPTPPTSYRDTDVQEGQFYYYTIWVQDNTVEHLWWMAGVATGLALKDFGYCDRFYELIPEWYRERDDTVSAIRPQPLYRFLCSVAIGADHVRTEYETLQWVSQPDRIAGGLLPLLAQQFGIAYETELGMRQMRTWLRNIVHLYKTKGSKIGVEGMVSAITGWGANAVFGKNLLLDTDSGTFASSVGQWEAITNATITSGALAPVEQNGTTQLRIRATGAGDAVVGMLGGGQRPLLRGIPVNAGTAYTASAYALGLDAGVATGVRVDILWYDVSDTLLSTTTGSATARNHYSTHSTYSRHSTTATAPTNAVRADMRIRVVAAGASEDTYIDAVQFEAASSATSYQPPRDIRITLIAERVNLFPNPNFETSLAHISAGNADTTLGRATAGGYFADARLTMTAPGSGSGPWTLVANSPSGTSGIPVQAGSNYTLSAYTRSEAVVTGRTARIDYTWYTSAGTQISYNTGSAITTGDAWVRPSVTVVAPSTAAYLRVGLVVLGVTAASEVHDWDGVLVEKTSELRDFFDGSALPAGDYMWAGTTHESASYLYRRRELKGARLLALLPEYLPIGATFTTLYAEQT